MHTHRYGAWRVNGVLSVARAIGDIKLKKWVIGTPDTAEFDLNGEEDFIILACDGLWDVMDHAKVCHVAVPVSRLILDYTGKIMWSQIPSQVLRHALPVLNCISSGCGVRRRMAEGKPGQLPGSYLRYVPHLHYYKVRTLPSNKIDPRGTYTVFACQMSCWGWGYARKFQFQTNLNPYSAAIVSVYFFAGCSEGNHRALHRNAIQYGQHLRHHCFLQQVREQTLCEKKGEKTGVPYFFRALLL